MKTREYLEQVAKETGCPECSSDNVKVLFVPAPDDDAVFNCRCQECGFEFEVNPFKLGE